MKNAGPSYHHIQLIRWDRDLTWQQVVDSLPADGAILPWMIPVGGIEGPVARVTPGESLADALREQAPTNLRRTW